MVVAQGENLHIASGGRRVPGKLSSRTAGRQAGLAAFEHTGRGIASALHCGLAVSVG
jgi:hypothetical protein